MAPIKAVALVSGGLDSTLAAKLVKDQGIDVIGLHLVSPFVCYTDVEHSTQSIGIPLIQREKGAKYLDLLEKPQYGYGKNMNPCVDCRIFMFQMAEQVMKEIGAEFIITGEVVGQRPMSQQKAAIQFIESQSPLQGKVVRPLSAKLLPLSDAEKNGWLDRKKLMGLWGRSRKVQLKMASDWGLTNLPTPSGGCLLTDAIFSKKLKDFFGHESAQTPEERLVQTEMLRFGRHFRFSDQTKVILARSDKENRELERLRTKTKGILFKSLNSPGPIAVGFGPVDGEVERLVGGLIFRFTRHTEETKLQIQYGSSDAQKQYISETPINDEELAKYAI